MTATMLRSRLESRWSSLKYLDDDSKLDLITMLTQSLKDSGNRKKISASEFYGIWGDDGMSDDEFVEALRETQLLCLQLEKLPLSAEHALEMVSFC